MLSILISRAPKRVKRAWDFRESSTHWTESHLVLNNSAIPRYLVTLWPHCLIRSRLKDNPGEGWLESVGQRKHWRGYIGALSVSGVQRRRRSREDLRLQVLKWGVSGPGPATKGGREGHGKAWGRSRKAGDGSAGVARGSGELTPGRRRTPCSWSRSCPRSGRCCWRRRRCPWNCTPPCGSPTRTACRRPAPGS